MNMTIVLPLIVAFIYLATAGFHLHRREYAWTWVWLCYGLANFGMIMAATGKAPQMLTIEETVKMENNYIMTIKRPDGSTLKVMIPIEGTEHWENRCVTEHPDVVNGLNLVTDGHYM